MCPKSNPNSSDIIKNHFVKQYIIKTNIFFPLNMKAAGKLNLQGFLKKDSFFLVNLILKKEVDNQVKQLAVFIKNRRRLPSSESKSPFMLIAF